MALIEIADVLVDADEFAENSGEFESFARDANAARKEGKLREEGFPFEGGEAKAKQLPLEVFESLDLPAQPPGLPFEPIGIGRPLGVEVLHVYAGDLPSHLFNRTPDVLVTSAARSWATTDAAPRALNRLAEDVGRREVIDFPAPSADRAWPSIRRP